MRQGSLVVSRPVAYNNTLAFAVAPGAQRAVDGTVNSPLLSVSVEDVDSGEVTGYLVVPSFRADADAGRISDASPVGKALKRSQAGETVEIAVPDGVLHYRVLSKIPLEGR